MHCLEAGLLILPFAFVLSFFGGLAIDSSSHLVAIIGAHPERYLEYVEKIALYWIFPLALSLVLMGVDSKRERSRTARYLSEWPLLIIGGIFLVWGALRLMWTNDAYYDALKLIQHTNVPRIDYQIMVVYTTVAIADFLWLTIGALLLCLPVIRLLRNKSVVQMKSASLIPQNLS
jgi:hypothetical protein